MRIEAEDIANMTTLISAAALDPGRWRDFVDALRASTGCARLNIFGRDRQTSASLGHVSSGYDDAASRVYGAHYARQNVWVPQIARQRVADVVSLRALCPYDRLRKTAFYQEWIRPRDDTYAGAAVKIAEDGPRFWAIGGHFRAAEADTLEAAWMRWLSLLVPGIRNALAVNILLGRTFIADLARGGDDGTTSAVLLIGRDRRILYANVIAQKLLAVGDAIGTDSSGRLRLRQPETEGWFARRLQTVDPAGPPNSLHFTLDAARGATYLCRTTRFVTGHAGIPAFGPMYPDDEDCVLVVLQPTGVPWRSIMRPILRERGLTAAEIDVALDLANGAPVAEIAKRRGVSVHTVRNQRHSALSKLGLSRQGQLAGLLLTLGGGRKQ